MRFVTTRDLQDYYEPLECRSRISLLDRLTCTAFSKLVWFNNPDGKARGSTLRHIDVDKAMEKLNSYLVENKDSVNYKVQNSLTTKRELLNVLKRLRDK